MVLLVITVLSAAQIVLTHGTGRLVKSERAGSEQNQSVDRRSDGKSECPRWPVGPQDACDERTWQLARVRTVRSVSPVL
jgi:hypothetical protein